MASLFKNNEHFNGLSLTSGTVKKDAKTDMQSAKSDI